MKKSWNVLNLIKVGIYAIIMHNKIRFCLDANKFAIDVGHRQKLNKKYDEKFQIIIEKNME
jgi:hypothetical protein